jgi:hypothetical protein
MASARFRTRLSQSLAVALVVAFGMTPHFARADEFGEKLQRDKAEATALSKEALGHVRKGEFEAARELYGRAFEKYPDVAIVFNWALAELNSGHELEALRHFRWYLRQKDADAAKVGVITNELLPRAVKATAHLHVTSAVGEAEITVDGQPAEISADGILDVLPGAHTVSATKGGARSVGHATTTAGQTTDVALEPSPLEPAPPPPAPQPPPTTSSHVVLAGPRPHESPPPYWDDKHIAVASLFGVALVAGGFVVGFAVDGANANSAENAAASHIPVSCANGDTTTQCNEYQRQKSRFDSDNTGAIVAGSVAGALWLGAMGCVLLWPEPKNPQAGFLRPTFDPVTRSAGVIGRF